MGLVRRLPKSISSTRSIQIDEEPMNLLREYFKMASGKFVIESNAAWSRKRTDQQYRCRRHFKGLAVWLREKGISDRNAVYVLRKEFCSKLVERTDLHTASRYMGHRSVATTARHYDNRSRKATVGLGAYLKGPDMESVEKAAGD
jgi:integrase